LLVKSVNGINQSSVSTFELNASRRLHFKAYQARGLRAD